MKYCIDCLIEKPFSAFPSDKHTKSGVRACCRECYARRNKGRKILLKELYRDQWPRICCVCKTSKQEDGFAEGDKHLMRPRCRECQAARSARYVSANRQKLSETRKARYAAVPEGERKAKRAEYYAQNREKVLEKCRNYHVRNAESRCARQREYYGANKEKAAKYMLRYVKNRYAADPLFALKMNLRGRINHVLAGNGWVKSRSNESILGCSYEYFLRYLSSMFVEGMSWSNRSAWHIDHKVPLSSAKTREEMYALCHYTNLQPLWAAENMSKGAKIL